MMGWHWTRGGTSFAGICLVTACGGLTDEPTAADTDTGGAATTGTSSGGNSSTAGASQTVGGSSKNSNALTTTTTTTGGATSITLTTTTTTTSSTLTTTTTTTGGATLSGGVQVLTDEELDALFSDACVGWSSEPEVLPPTIQFVVDLAAGMARPESGGTGSNWDATRAVLLAIIEGLFDTTVVGLSFFPNQANAVEPATEGCINTAADVPIDLLGSPGSEQRTLLEQALLAASPLEGAGAPIHDAYLRGLDAFAGAPIPVLTLVTEGELNFDLACSGAGSPGEFLDPQALIDDIAVNADSGVTTLVIGSPGSGATLSGVDARPWLTEAARAGRGTLCPESPPSHIDMTATGDPVLAFQDELAHAQWGVPGCSLAMPAAPAGEMIDPSFVNLIIRQDGLNYVLFPSDDPHCELGFYFAGPSTINLCSESCQQITCGNPSSLTALFGCD